MPQDADIERAPPDDEGPSSAAAQLLSESDLAVIDALQVNPRATWVEIAAVLDVDPVTVARRWQRLSAAGEAWATIALGQRQLHTMSVAVLELDCEAGAASQVAGALAPMRHLISIQHVAGSYDLWVLAVAESLPALADYLLAELPRLGGVRKVRTHMATRVFDASRRWRLRVLHRTAAEGLRNEVDRVAGSTRPMDAFDRRLFTLLSVDGRAGYVELAATLGTSARTVQRRLTRLVTAGDVDFRCDLARPLAGWQTAAVLWLQMPDDALELTGHELLTWQETRTCAALAGPHNMIVTMGLHAVSDLHLLVSRLRRELPHVQIADRQLVLRQTKLYGRVLGASGRGVQAIPVDPWAPGRHGRKMS